jgi:hypothetical protein
MMIQEFQAGESKKILQLPSEKQRKFCSWGVLPKKLSTHYNVQRLRRQRSAFAIPQELQLMTSQQLLQIALSFLSGGFVVTVLNWFREAASERKARRTQFVSEQLRLLYGPLYFYAAQNEKIAELGSAIDHAYKVEYCDTKWSSEPATQEAIGEEASKTIALLNRYSLIKRANNEKMVTLITENYSLIDLDDSEPFQEFVLASVRERAEVSEDRLETPRRIYNHMGDIIYYSSTFVDLVRTRFVEKTKELRQQKRRPWWRQIALSRSSVQKNAVEQSDAREAGLRADSDGRSRVPPA